MYFQVDYLRGLITVECMTITCIWVKYILDVRDFHRKAHRPDIYREEFVQLVCPENAMRLTNEVITFELVLINRKDFVLGTNHIFWITTT